MSLNYTHNKKNDKLDCTEVFFLSQINKDQERVSDHEGKYKEIIQNSAERNKEKNMKKGFWLSDA